jgi:RNA polymerase sigma factor (sigma-70 family)
MKIVHEVPTPLPEADEGTPDGLVIARSRAEPEQFALLFRRHAGGIGRYAARRLGPGAAEDIVAETFLAAFRHRDRYDVTRPDALPWLYGIAGNLIRRHARDEVRMLRALARTGLDPVAESFTDRSDARMAAGATRRAVADALAALDPDQRDVVLLIAWAELTYNAVAEALGIPEGTVRSRMNRARARLRAALGGTDPTRIPDGQEHHHG